ncbi:MAG: GxxExxY protein [Verrucomicrobiales bacterium]|nr:GxxExxY protein [Verrucomicrobiales bacterium]
MNEIIYKDEAYRIIGACFEVYKEKGNGFLEAVYQECLEIELSSQWIAFQARLPIDLSYKGQSLVQRYVADMVCFGTVLVELKAVSALADEHRAQVINYLHAGIGWGYWLISAVIRNSNGSGWLYEITCGRRRK